MALDPLDQIAEICALQPECSLSKIADVLGYDAQWMERQTKQAQILTDLRQLASEAGDHTPQSFQRAVIRLANRAHALTRGVREVPRG